MMFINMFMKAIRNYFVQYFRQKTGNGDWTIIIKVIFTQSLFFSKKIYKSLFEIPGNNYN